MSKEELEGAIEKIQSGNIDDDLISLLKRMGISFGPKKTQEKLFESYDVKGIAKKIKESKKILVMSGAGISTAAGIPDFRSPKTGLYQNLQKYNLQRAEDIFDIDYFREKPKAFCTLAKELYPSNFEPTPVHYFIKLLEKKGLLLRCYSQNIDTLERMTGMDESLLVEAHGSFGNAHCIDCHEPYTADTVKEILFKDEIPTCTKCKGLVKPDIVFFGESLPERFHTLLPKDTKQADFLMVMGTSLAVAPFCRIVDMVTDDTPRTLINWDEVGSFDFGSRDSKLLGDCQVSILELAKELGWYDELKEMSKTKSWDVAEKLLKEKEEKNQSVVKTEEKLKE